jgi:hypothetical protein
MGVHTQVAGNSNFPEIPPLARFEYLAGMNKFITKFKIYGNNEIPGFDEDNHVLKRILEDMQPDEII